MARDTRLHPRLRLDVVADSIGDEVVLGHPLDDISMGGCRFLGAAWEREGTELQLVLCFPAVGANLPMAGVVVRASDEDMGVRFQKPSDEQKWALRKHMREAQR